jgi:hypothetical protein
VSSLAETLHGDRLSSPVRQSPSVPKSPEPIVKSCRRLRWSTTKDSVRSKLNAWQMKRFRCPCSRMMNFFIFSIGWRTTNGRQITGNPIAAFGELLQETNCRPGKLFDYSNLGWYWICWYDSLIDSFRVNNNKRTWLPSTTCSGSLTRRVDR